jgi:uncharacterized repeat protein (TIGR04042 family)
MPEMRMSIRWPDRTQESCYSPSLVLKDYFQIGRSYALADFRDRCRMALTVASERVKAKFGFPCSRAAHQLARIEERCGAFAAFPGAQVCVEAFHEEEQGRLR